MMKHDPMKQALMKRKAHGLDITIVLGGMPEKGMMPGGQESKESDLAPSPESDKAEMSQETDEIPAEAKPEDEKSDDEGFADEMLGSMSEFDKADLMKRSPRSLGERAKQVALQKK